MIFVGYEIASKAYRLWNPEIGKIIVSTNVVFDESVLPKRPIPPALPPTPANIPSSSSKIPLFSPEPTTTVNVPCFLDDNEPTKKPPSVSTNKGKQREDPPPPFSPPPRSPSLPADHLSPPQSPTSPNQPLPSTPPNESTPEGPPSTPTKPQRRQQRNVKGVEKYVADTSGLGSAETEGEHDSVQKFKEAYCQLVELYTSISLPNEPKSYKDAKSSDNASKWDLAMKEEIDTLEKRGTWEVVDRPANKPVVSCKWVYKLKINSAGEIAHYKARLVARGFSQTYGVDYKETFTPVTHLETLRLMFAFAVEKD